MTIEIDDTLTLEEIRKRFTAKYPFLKLEFYDEPHQWQESTKRKHLLDHDKTIAQVRKKHNPGALEILPGQKTGSVEQAFHNRFGLNVQLFRRHGDSWVQTVGTDELTLAEQNEIGQRACEDMMHGTNRKFEPEKRL